MEDSLSNKIVMDGRHPDYDVDVIRAQDVKQFIKELKEDLDIVLISEADQHKANARINALAGKGLI